LQVKIPGKNKILDFHVCMTKIRWSGGFMTTFLSKELHADLTRAQKDKKVKKSRLRVEFDGALVPVLKLWDNGFSMDIEHAPQLRGLVDIFDGSRHLSQCLIIASTEESGEIHFEFKRSTDVTDTPALDFVLPKDKPVALLN
jgi:hypothetical protein